MKNANEQSVYVILINEDNTMTTTQKRRIVQRSKLVDDLWFLVKPEYNGYNMADFTVILEYLQPVSKKYRTEFLTLSNEQYNEYLKYTLPVDTKITSEAGDVELQVSFITTELDENGKGIQRVRKIVGTTISVTPISAWSDIIPDCALSALDQRIIKIDAQMKAINETNDTLNRDKVDNISYDYDNNELQLMSGDKPIGNKITLNNECTDKDGMPVVDFTVAGSNPDDDDKDDNSNDVVEF